VTDLIWLPEARDDSERLFRFLLDVNPGAAERAVRLIQTGARSLLDQPEMGRPMGDGSGRREIYLPFGASAYVLRYRVDDQGGVGLPASAQPGCGQPQASPGARPATRVGLGVVCCWATIATIAGAWGRLGKAERAQQELANIDAGCLGQRAAYISSGVRLATSADTSSSRSGVPTSCQ
jgi:plasmid stabilization system protein ParE